MKSNCALFPAVASAAVFLAISPFLQAGNVKTLHFPGMADKAGSGKKIVLVAGDEEYRTEESMPMLGKILSQHHGFDCTVVFSWDPTGTYIDPNNQAGLRGLAALDDADLMIIGTRFRKPNEEEAAHITRFLNVGKPLIGIRTSTHAFNGKGDFGGLKFGEFGRKIMGETWVNHHGKHKTQGTRALAENSHADHPILQSVDHIFTPTDVYGVIHLTDADTILLRGAVTESLNPLSKIIDGEKNHPTQPLAWLHPYTAPNGTAHGQTFCTTMGASVDLTNEGLRRLLVNAAYYLTGLQVPEKADVDFVDPFDPSFYGFVREKGWYKNLNLQPADFGLGKTTHTPDPKGSPKWEFWKKQ